MKKFILICLLLTVSFCEVNKRSFSAPSYSVEDLDARIFSDSRVIVVNGYVKNSSFQSTSGEVLIYLKKGNSIIITLKEVVNKGTPFAHNEKGFFEAVTNLSENQKLDTVTVEYIPYR